jgi:hypothetical protein
VLPLRRLRLQQQPLLLLLLLLLLQLQCYYYPYNTTTTTTTAVAVAACNHRPPPSAQQTARRAPWPRLKRRFTWVPASLSLSLSRSLSRREAVHGTPGPSRAIPARARACGTVCSLPDAVASEPSSHVSPSAAARCRTKPSLLSCPILSTGAHMTGGLCGRESPSAHRLHRGSLQRRSLACLAGAHHAGCGIQARPFLLASLAGVS